MDKARVLVAGGGIGGLAAAIGLLRKGFEVEVFEGAQSFGEVGAGVTLAPNAMAGLQYLGLGPRIEAAGSEPMRQVVRHWEDGRVLKTLERGNQMREKYGVPYLYMHRADLHAILVETARELGGKLHLSARVSEAGHDGAEAWLKLEDGTEHRGDLLVGADGLKSVVRRIFEPISAHFTGHVAWRGVVPVDAELRELAENPGNFIGPERMAVWYPLRGGTQINLVFFAREEGWTDDGWTIPARRAELQQVFAGWCEPIQYMIAHLEEDRLFKWAINARSALSTWNQGGCITLLGDAAHAMTPFLGQGASCAIEDAVVLSRAMEGSDTVAEAIERYERARIEHATFIQAESNANAERLQSKDADNFGKKEVRNEETLGLFAYDAGKVEV
ncbi:FAD-dependent monooxygenase [Novosphingobium resinovorum]|uniref:2-polyprenyl-6-methoxyphenol hydroxylase-like oxidoreductase n=1 Tax=Novosphingobium resinovorum TaxID=158500 RepID=A0A031JPA9_9SPHN|nr:MULTISPECIES: FAD-dependent monooxygenase [Novosphingobium]AOR79573.1 salicylate 1-monooxygenase [Novosphingobium resinovorum]EZP75697.1 2-polyprenyl-6-methoxyphenol hydroxylase-like oxidoreductase precursor [Novosphingobium resinovorum]MBF7013491.1 FAD-dependent monooxygenase [Novosphingobium sp. HR1a]WJM25639.1 FAD-dependent monooxygenase [Novosphingobium resinovorum]